MLIPNDKVYRFLLGFIAVGLVIIIALIFFPGKPSIPGPIKSQLTSTLLIPKGGDYITDRESAKYDSKIKLLTFRTQIKGLTTVTVSEQATPDQFTDIPTYSEKVFQKFGEYKTFEMSIGIVHLVRSPKDKQQAAVINTKGTLMFVKPDKDLTEDQWREFFKNIAVIQ